MRIRHRHGITFIALAVVCSMLVACNAARRGGAASSTKGVKPAMVDAVAVERRDGHLYAVVTGNYSDACSRISDVAQEVNGNTFQITLSTAAPEGLMCATVLTPFKVDVLLEVGGQAPGEYTVDVNDSATAAFTLGP